MQYHYTKVCLAKSTQKLAYKNFINYNKKIQNITITSQNKGKSIIFMSLLSNNLIKFNIMMKKSQKFVKLWTIRPLALYTNFKEKSQ